MIKKPVIIKREVKLAYIEQILLKKQGSVIQEFDEELLFTTLEKVEVNPENISFVFKNGSEIKIIN